MSKPLRALILGAHPDDEVLGCGGTAARMAADGAEVFLCLLCESSSPRYRMEMIDVLKERAQMAARVLGIRECSFYDFSNVKTNAIPLIQFVEAISEVLAKYKPNVIFTHHRGDVHVDHQMVFKATLGAARMFGQGLIEQMLCYEVASSTEWAAPFPDEVFLPNVFYDIGSTIGLKTQAMTAYKSEIKEFPHPRSMRAIYTYARRWGLKAGIGGYVEPFELLREIR